MTEEKRPAWVDPTEERRPWVDPGWDTDMGEDLPGVLTAVALTILGVSVAILLIILAARLLLGGCE